MRASILKSAHVDKMRPRNLVSFRQAKFAGNITAYETPWTGSTQTFPINSHKELGISPKAFQALQILFPYLDSIFRATGAQFIPQLHSTVANHLNGLHNLCNEIFSEEVKARVSDQLSDKFEALEKSVRLSLMLHDLPEIPGEVSTFCQRLPITNASMTEADRQKLENRIAELLLYYSLKAVYEGESYLPKEVQKAIIESQQKARQTAESAEERFRIVKSFADNIEIDMIRHLDPDFKKDFEQLKEAYYIAYGGCKFKSQESLVGNLVKLIDKLESKLHCAIVGDYSIFDMEPREIIEREFNQAREFITTYAQDELVRPILDKIIELYEASVKVFREWDKFNEPLKLFNLR